MAFLADGTMFFTEKCRGLSVRAPGGTVTRLFGTSAFVAGSTGGLVASDFFCEGQSGMHGVAVDPQFASNRYIYVYMASSLTTNPRANRVVRLVVNSNNTAVSGRTDIVTGLAYKNAGTANGGAGAHSGGRIRFSPADGYLYITTGDNHDGELPQHPTRLGGKVLRVDRDGNAAPGNNAPAGFDARIFTYGHRNPQGITFRPGSNQPFTAEHGPGHSDEVTALVAGGNAGWDPRPNVGARGACPGDYCGYQGDATFMPMTDTTRFPNALRPTWNNSGASGGMGPATFLSGTQWKLWDGRLLVGIMGSNRLDLLELNTAGTSATRSAFGTLPGARYRSLVQGPDGNLYVATDGGEIWRVVPQ
ncbi:MAG: PQQ-dependent sugar dehydrogenase [Burkholderiaceae bacterium]|nr:PQQ-dependent sugar dehydrogenase [Burkholderiaceae bacterium]